MEGEGSYRIGSGRLAATAASTGKFPNGNPGARQLGLRRGFIRGSGRFCLLFVASQRLLEAADRLAETLAELRQLLWTEYEQSNPEITRRCAG